MNITLVTESHFGNTAALADALEEGAAAAGASVTRLGPDADALPPGADLLVLAAPTHNMGLSRPASRGQAAAQGAAPGPARGIREWIEAVDLPAGLPVRAIATVTGPMSGSAAKAAGQLLRRRGVSDFAHTDFVVGGTKGPLRDGELERARALGERLVTGAPEPDRAQKAGGASPASGDAAPRRGFWARLFG